MSSNAWPSIEDARKDLINPDRGYVILRNWYAPDEVVAYRERCRAFLEGRHPTIHTRINLDTIPDYVHPRSHDKCDRTYRIYQFFHNHTDDEDGRFFEKIMSYRRQIESGWETDPVYVSEQKRLQDYIIVTKYVPNTGLLLRHRDYSGPAPYPLIQTLVPLSECGRDYTGGDFILYTKSGRQLSINDLNLRLGDCFLFDKSLYHEVEQVGNAPGSDVGRWSVLVGARAPRHASLEGTVKSLLWRTPIYDIAVLPIKSVWQSLKTKKMPESAAPDGDLHNHPVK